MWHNQVKLKRIRNCDLIVVPFSTEEFQCSLLCDSALVIRMEKHIADKDIDNGRMDVNFKSSSSRPKVDMRNHGVLDGNLAVKESKFLVISGSLICGPDGRMFWLVMILIPIGSKTFCPCHFCCFLGSLTRLFRIGFRAIVNTELTLNRNYFWSTWTSLHDLEAIHRYMLSQETCFGALSLPSFGHSTRENGSMRSMVDGRSGWSRMKF